MREQQCRDGLIPHDKPSTPSACSPFDTVEQECAGRLKALTGQARVFRQQLPVLLRRLSKIPDPRQPKKTKHKLTVLMIYGILVFVLQYSSRRQANADITHPMIGQNLRLLFPELESIPHADTLFRLLSRIDVSQIEQAQIELVNQLIRKKKFRPMRVNNCYPVAIDGTQKLGGLELWSEAQLQYRIPSSSDTETPEEPSVSYRYSVSVLEANLSFRNGMVIPLMTQFLDYREGDSEREKQDCETRAFHRLAERIKKAFPRLPLMLLLDGLYAQGPVIQRCHDYHWQFMIVLRDDSLPTVWEEYHGLLDLQPDNEHRQHWGNRRQHFRWVNHIRYEYGSNACQYIDLHVVVCNEQWEEVNEHNEMVTKTAKHAWLSSRALNAANVHPRCNLAARYRWGIETHFLV
ncbi:MAG: transposase family protein, partial [Halieaceae bacterium]|nr:transposase family protein [Halieaceae bacterium]